MMICKDKVLGQECEKCCCECDKTECKTRCEDPCGPCNWREENADEQSKCDSKVVGENPDMEV